MPPADATGPDTAQPAADASQPAADTAQPAADTAQPAVLEAYARAAAHLTGLDIDDAWWPGVLRHLDVLLQRAASLEASAVSLPDDPAPVFRP